MNRIEKKFNDSKASGKKCLISYITAGDPEKKITADLMHTLVSSGTDIIELGIPFSDPMADGPVIQKACERALINKTSCKDIFNIVKEFRKNVMPTLWAEINSNPSGTAYTLLGALQRKGFFNFPLVGPKIEEAVKTAEDFGAAKDALRQKVARSSAPLLSNATQAALRDNLLEQSTPDLPELDETRIQMENFEMPREIDVSPTQQIDVFEEPEQRPLSMSLPTFDPLPVEADTSMAVNPALSPTLLPSEEDREIAMRMQQPGIAGLVV